MVLKYTVFIHNQERIKSFDPLLFTTVHCKLPLCKVKWHSINYILNTIVDVNESNVVLQTEMLFSDFFPSRWWPVGTLTDISMCKRHQVSTGKQNAGVIELIVDNWYNEKFVQDFSVRKRTQKIVKLHITTQRKKPWLLELDLAKKKLMAQRNQHLSFKYKEFVLAKNYFCNWCCSSNYWDY